MHAAVVEATLPPASLIRVRKAVELYLPPGPVPAVLVVPVVVPDVVPEEVVVVPEPVVVLEPDVVVLEPDVVVLESGVSVLASGVSVLESGVSVLESGVSVLEPEAVPEPEDVLEPCVPEPARNAVHSPNRACWLAGPVINALIPDVVPAPVKAPDGESPVPLEPLVWLPATVVLVVEIDRAAAEP